MRVYLVLLILLFFNCCAYALQKTDSLLAVLKKEMSNEKNYEQQKEARIKRLRDMLAATPPSNYAKVYGLCSGLYEEYKVYKFDSAYVYTNRLLDLSHRL